MATCGIIPPRQRWVTGVLDDDDYLAECILPQGHRGESHVIQIPTGIYVKWEDDDDCGCCEPDEEDRCYTYGEISISEYLNILKGLE